MSYLPTQEEIERLFLYPDDRNCMELLWMKKFGTKSIQCPGCGELRKYGLHYRTNHRKNNHNEGFRCSSRSCGYVMSALTGTIFSNSRLPLIKWYKALYTLRMSPDVPGIELAQKIDCNKITARRIKKLILAELART